jgi:hypothetical protein
MGGVEEGSCKVVLAQPKTMHTRLLFGAFPLPVIDPLWISRPNPAM